MTISYKKKYLKYKKKYLQQKNLHFGGSNETKKTMDTFVRSTPEDLLCPEEQSEISITFSDSIEHLEIELNDKIINSLLVIFSEMPQEFKNIILEKEKKSILDLFKKEEESFNIELEIFLGDDLIDLSQTFVENGVETNARLSTNLTFEEFNEKFFGELTKILLLSKNIIFTGIVENYPDEFRIQELPPNLLITLALWSIIGLGPVNNNTWFSENIDFSEEEIDPEVKTRGRHQYEKFFTPGEDNKTYLEEYKTVKEIITKTQTFLTENKINNEFIKIPTFNEYLINIIFSKDEKSFIDFFRIQPGWLNKLLIRQWYGRAYSPRAGVIMPNNWSNYLENDVGLLDDPDFELLNEPLEERNHRAVRRILGYN